MLYCKKLFLIIISSLFIVGCSGDGSFDDADFDEAPPSSGESILDNSHGPYSQTNWMNADWFWDANPSLASITLPGTHDSGTSNYKDPLKMITAQCQAVNINVQFEWGVRFFDLRVSVDKYGVPGIYHGSAGYANRTLDQVLLGLANALTRYPSECVVLCFKREYAETEQKTIIAIENLLYKYRHFIYDKHEIPRINDVRGKMIYWRRYGAQGVGPGLKVEFPDYGTVNLYENAELFCQDKAETDGNTKYNLIMSAVGHALAYSGIKSGHLLLCVNFTSYYNTIPQPLVDGLRMNARVRPNIVNGQRANGNWPIYLGIIASDAVSAGYMNTVLGTNFMTQY